MKDLFYAPSEKRLFYIAGYLSTKLSDINKQAELFAKIAKCSVDAVSTFEVQNSQRYKYMHVFYVDNVETIDGAFNLGDNWGMYSWIQY